MRRIQVKLNRFNSNKGTKTTRYRWEIIVDERRMSLLFVERYGWTGNKAYAWIVNRLPTICWPPGPLRSSLISKSGTPLFGALRIRLQETTSVGGARIRLGLKFVRLMMQPTNTTS